MSQAPPCCTIAPVTPEKYDAKGKFDLIEGEGGMKCYITGPPTATKAIIFVYDIFGYYAQTLQAADILAFNDEKNPYLVFMPDLFNGSAMNMTFYDKPKEERKPEEDAACGAFFGGAGNMDNAISKLPGFVEAVKKQFPELLLYAGFGTCWGANVIIQNSLTPSLFTCSAGAHPAFAETWNAEDVTVPLALLVSSNEIANPAAKVDDKEKALREKGLGGFLKRFEDMKHGFMAAKADLKSEEGRKGYLEGYGVVLGFFNQFLK